MKAKKNEIIKLIQIMDCKKYQNNKIIRNNISIQLSIAAFAN